jgi:hypothetical protein
MIVRLVALVLLGGCGLAPECGDTVVEHVSSPYGRGAAIVFDRNCGATTAFTTHVAIVDHVDAQPRREDLVFVADADHGAAPSRPGGGPEVRVRWIDGVHLRVAHHPRARAFRREEAHGRVRITYTTLP